MERKGLAGRGRAEEERRYRRRLQAAWAAFEGRGNPAAALRAAHEYIGAPARVFAPGAPA